MSAEYPREPREPVRDREVIVSEPAGGGPGGVIAVIIGIVALVLVVWLLISTLGGSGEDLEVDGGLDVPEEIDVNVDNGGTDTTGGTDAGTDTSAEG